MRSEGRHDHFNAPPSSDGTWISNLIFDLASARGSGTWYGVHRLHFPCNDPVIKYLTEWQQSTGLREA